MRNKYPEYEILPQKLSEKGRKHVYFCLNRKNICENACFLFLFDGNINLNYINIPILANVYVADGLALKAGVQPGFNVSSKISASPLELDIKDGVNSVDFSIPVGISYEYANVCLDARYNIGVTNTFKDSDNSRNSVFQLTLGYKFKL